MILKIICNERFTSPQRNPFEYMLIAQTKTENLTIITKDENYSNPIINLNLYQYKKPKSQSGILFPKPISILSAEIYEFWIFAIC